MSDEPCGLIGSIGIGELVRLVRLIRLDRLVETVRGVRLLGSDKPIVQDDLGRPVKLVEGWAR